MSQKLGEADESLRAIASKVPDNERRNSREILGLGPTLTTVSEGREMAALRSGGGDRAARALEDMRRSDTQNSNFASERSNVSLSLQAKNSAIVQVDSRPTSTDTYTRVQTGRSENMVLATRSSSQSAVLASRSISGDEIVAQSQILSPSSSEAKLQDRSSTSSSYFDDEFEVPPGQVDINRAGIVPSLIFTFLWTVSTCICLIGFILIYGYQEVGKVETQGVKVAVDFTRLRVAEVLTPAIDVVRAMDVAFRTGAVSSLSDYTMLANLLAPHFAAAPSLREVELAAAPGARMPGSLLVSRDAGIAKGPLGLRLRTDLEDCHLVPGHRGCSVRPLLANFSGWYRSGFNLDGQQDEVFGAPPASWVGPSFVRIDLHEITCNELCWLPTYSFTGKAGGAAIAGYSVASADILMPPEETTPPPNASANATGNVTPVPTPVPTPFPTPAPRSSPTVLVRAAIDASALQNVIKQAELFSHGEVLICTKDGLLIAASDMSAVVKTELATGAVKVSRIWDLPREWAASVAGNFVRKSTKDVMVGGSKVSAWKLSGTSNATQTLKDHLRIVLVVPGNAFTDEVLGPLLPWAWAVSGTPATALVLVTIVAGWKHFCGDRGLQTLGGGTGDT